MQDLQLNSLELYNFRNFASAEFRAGKDSTILVGPNAVGKTSIIEAIQLVTSLSSFRCTQSKQLVTWNAEESRVKATFTSDKRLIEVVMTVKNGMRRYYLNGKKKTQRELRGLLPSVVFTPDDLNLVKGSNTTRRDAIDSIGCQISKNYYTVLKDYKTLVKQKNKALKEECDDIYLETINELMIKVGIQLLSYRCHILKKFSPFYLQYYSEIAGDKEPARLIYTPFWLDENQTETYEFNRDDALSKMKDSFSASAEKERRRAACCVGVQKDSLAFFLEGKNALHYASQGQQRSLVLAFKLAELALLQEELQQRPILLLDDVMSELDETRRRAFMGMVKHGTQTFITTTNPSYFDPEIIDSTHIVTLSAKGEILCD